MSQEEITIEITTTEVTVDPTVTETLTVEVKEVGAQGLKGDTGDQGIQGIQGITGNKGDTGDTGVGVIPGGTIGQALVKASATDYDMTWQSSSGDMSSAVYDPQAKAVDAFKHENMDGVYIDLDTGVAAPTRKEGRLFYDDERKCIGLYIDETEFTWQIGRELPMRVYNNTAGTLLNGRAARVAGVGTGGGTYTLPYIDYASSDFALGVAGNTIGIITHDIEAGTFGEVTIHGWVNDVNTDSPLVAGSIAWLEASSPADGKMTAVQPSSPNYAMEMGGCLVSDASVGVLWASYLPQGNKHDVWKVYNGAILEHHTVDVSSNGTVITATLDNTGSPYLSMFFNADFYEIAVPATVSLSAGSDTVPLLNYVYIPETTKVLTTSISGWPAGQHVPVATVICQSASSVLADEVYKLHAWTDHLTGGNDQGHIAHINKWLRSQDATWLSGVANTYAGSGTGTVTIGTTSVGSVLQLHEHNFPIFSDPATFYVINDSVTAYISNTNLASILLDSEGASLTNRKFALVLWGCVSEDDDQCKLFINLPSGSYLNTDLAAEDASKFTNYVIPTDYKGTGFLIRRYICTWNAAGTTLTITDYAGDELRGSFPNSTAGGSSSSGDFDPSGTAETFMDAHTINEAYPAAYDHSTFLTAVADGSDGTAIHDNVASEISAVTEKATPISADMIIIEDSADSNSKKMVQVGNLPAVGVTDADAIHDNIANEISAVAEKTVPIDNDLILIEDSAAAGVKKKVKMSNLPVGSAAVSGPVSSTDNAIPRFDGTGGKTIQDSGVVIDDNGNVAGSGSQINAQTGTAYTMVLSDAGKLVTRGNASASTHVIPANASVAYPVGTVINVLNIGAGTITFSITSDTLNKKGTALDLVQGGAVTLAKTDTTTWWIFGDLS